MENEVVLKMLYHFRKMLEALVFEYISEVEKTQVIEGITLEVVNKIMQGFLKFVYEKTTNHWSV